MDILSLFREHRTRLFLVRGGISSGTKQYLRLNFPISRDGPVPGGRDLGEHQREQGENPAERVAPTHLTRDITLFLHALSWISPTSRGHRTKRDSERHVAKKRAFAASDPVLFAKSVACTPYLRGSLAYVLCIIQTAHETRDATRGIGDPANGEVEEQRVAEKRKRFEYEFTSHRERRENRLLRWNLFPLAARIRA